jgi:predicted phage tail protein
MIRRIILHGQLAEQFGDEFTLDVLTPAEAVRALCVQLKDFANVVREGTYRCIRGGFEDGVECDEALLHLRFGSLRDFHIVPVAGGAKSGGIAKIILGVVLIAASFIPGVAAFTIPVLGSNLGSMLFGVGAMMALGGISQLISPTPNNNPTTFLFNGPVNTGQSGVVCPIVFGRVRAGSVTVSAGIIAEQIGNSIYGAVQSPTGNISYVGGSGPEFF